MQTEENKLHNPQSPCINRPQHNSVVTSYCQQCYKHIQYNMVHSTLSTDINGLDSEGQTWSSD